MISFNSEMLSRDLEDDRFGVPGRVNLGSDALFCQEMIPGTQDFFLP